VRAEWWHFSEKSKFRKGSKGVCVLAGVWNREVDKNWREKVVMS
jgi:hypothetical protein